MFNEDEDVGPQRMTEALMAYEEAVKEFSESATEFLEHVPLLTQAWDAYQRASAASTQLREILDRGDETLQNCVAQIQQTLNIPLVKTASDERRLEALKVETIKARGEKADAAKA